MDATVIGAIIGAVAVIIAAIIGWIALARSKAKEAPKIQKTTYHEEFLDDKVFSEKLKAMKSCAPSLDGPWQFVNGQWQHEFDLRYRLDAIQKQSPGREPKFSFDNIEIAIDKCTWYANPNILTQYQFKEENNSSPFRSFSIADVDTFDIRLKPFYFGAKYHFEQGKTLPRELKTKNPVLDITLNNSSRKQYIIYSVGVIPLALWSIPKMVLQPDVIIPFDLYYLNCNFEKLLCNLKFDNPLLLTSKGVFRFQLCLKDYVKELLYFRQNESLIALIINNGHDTCLISESIYLGIVG